MDVYNDHPGQELIGGGGVLDLMARTENVGFNAEDNVRVPINRIQNTSSNLVKRGNVQNGVNGLGPCNLLWSNDQHGQLKENTERIASKVVGDS